MEAAFVRTVDETAGTIASFGFHPWNSNPKKVAMYIALGLFVIMVVQVLRKQLDLTDPGILTLWTFFTGIFTFLLGKNQEGEVRHRRRARRGQPPEQE